jgi:hypothetical protein
VVEGLVSVEPQFERVYTVTDYYDGPRGGVANFRGEPHRYRSVYLDSATWEPDEDRFELQPISAEALQLALEDWAIWRRWEEAFHTGQTDLSTHPALPEDRARHEVIEAALAEASSSNVSSCLIARGEFRVVDRPSDSPKGVLSTMEVRWSELPTAEHGG